MKPTPKITPPKPLRIQRSRRHIIESPNGLPIQYVGRPSKWGNPFKCVNGQIFIKTAPPDQPGPGVIKPSWLLLGDGDAELVVKLYRSLVQGTIKYSEYTIEQRKIAILKLWGYHFSKLKITDLAGMNLSCWCKAGEPCHVDFLLNHANKPKTL